MPQLLFKDDPQFWFETLRVIGAADYGGAQFGEAVMTASRIKAGDYDCWHDEWKAAADRVSREADESLAAGRRVSARDGLLRASNYYRNAEFFLHGKSRRPKTAPCVRAQRRLLQASLPLVRLPNRSRGNPLRADYAARLLLSS